MSLADNAARMIAAKGEEISLIRTTRAAPADATPWIPGTATTETYQLDAKIKGVKAEHIDGTTVVASDRIVIASPRARLNGSAVDLVPVMTDKLLIGGVETVIKRISPKVDGGTVAKFHIFVGS